MTDEAFADKSEELARCVEMLRALSQQPEVFFGPNRDSVRAVRAEASRLVAAIQKVNRGHRCQARDQQRHRAAEVRARQRAERAVNGLPIDSDKTRPCYACYRRYDKQHDFYDTLCPECAELSYAKRSQSGDLSVHHGLVTGGRIKIGYHCALKLLRAGARVSVTTRFVCDAARRFAAEEDAGLWRSRLRIYGLDLRDLGATQRLAEALSGQQVPLSIVINNAAQTIRRPAAYYRSLLEGEQVDALPKPARELVDTTPFHQGEGVTLRRILGGGSLHSARLPSQQAPATHLAAQLTQLPLLAEDSDDPAELFPRPDGNEEPVDLRDATSWTKVLGEIDPVELIETHLVGAFSPFVLLQLLVPLLARAPVKPRHVINVSAAEGIFDLQRKARRHPHTNMAKASLNMLTRTSAEQLREQDILINSVDPGWVSANQPTARRKAEPLLDLVDGAARILDPIFMASTPGVDLATLPSGQLFRHFKPHPW